MNDLARIVIEVVLFLISCYLIFFRKFFAELGKQTAEIALMSKKTEEVEKVKEVFNKNLESFKNELELHLAKEIEFLKSSLERSNIAFQVATAEFARLRFERIDVLYGRLYELQKYVKQNLFYYSDNVDYETKRQRFFKLYQRTEDALYSAMIYIDDSIAVSTNVVLDECSHAFEAFIAVYNTDPRTFGPLIYQNQQLVKSLVEKNVNALEKLEKSVQKFPELLKKLRVEFREQLQSSDKHNRG